MPTESVDGVVQAGELHAPPCLASCQSKLQDGCTCSLRWQLYFRSHTRPQVQVLVVPRAKDNVAVVRVGSVAPYATTGALASSWDALLADSDLRAYRPCHRRDCTAGTLELLYRCYHRHYQ